MIKDSEYYAYAQGYYDGRVIGVDQDLPDMARMSSICRSRYKEGYECGVADYCESGVEVVSVKLQGRDDYIGDGDND